MINLSLTNCFCQVDDIVRWSIAKPHGPYDVIDIEYVTEPIAGKAILKILKPSEVLAYGKVVKVERAAKQVLVRRLVRVPGEVATLGLRKWRIKATGGTALLVKRLAWSQLLDFKGVEEVVV